MHPSKIGNIPFNLFLMQSVFIMSDLLSFRHDPFHVRTQFVLGHVCLHMDLFKILFGKQSGQLQSVYQTRSNLRVFNLD